MTSARPLVSILIPAYHERFFGEALASALAQTYAPLEVVVCDDSPGAAIGEAARRAADPRVRYLRNPARLGFAGNFTQCFNSAQGEFIKFLNDDDRLHPLCVERLAGVLMAFPQVGLATSRRAVIDAGGRRLADIPATRPLSMLSAIVAGRELGDLVLSNSVNFIGEPSTTMFRKAQLPIESSRLFRWGGRDYHCLADLALWLPLISNGFAYYAAEALSEFRMHPDQEQERDDLRFDCTRERLWIARQARAHGFLAVVPLWRAALHNVRARVQACTPELMDEATRRDFLAFAAELDAEIAAS